jgi:threonine dehydrogenase-like Zn-dependent dehydrogenase
MMKAAVKTTQGSFEIKDVPTPEVTRPDYVLAKVRSAGVCGSDLRWWKIPRPQLVGRITGHELAGDVIEVGPDVLNVKRGDRVAIESLVGCGVCYWCRVGQYHLCPDLGKLRSETLSRAFSEYVAGPAANFFKIPEKVSYEEAAILDVYGTSIHACNRTGIRMGQNVVVIGAGPIGLTMLELANVAGAKTIVTGVYDYPLEVAEKLGAYATINTRSEDGVAKVLELTSGMGADIAYECVGGEAAGVTMKQAVSYVRRGGKVGIIGALADGLDWPRIRGQEIDLISISSFSYWGNDREFKIVLDLLIDEKIDANSLITHRFPLERINEAFETADNKRKTNAIKVVIVS